MFDISREEPSVRGTAGVVAVGWRSAGSARRSPGVPRRSAPAMNHCTGTTERAARFAGSLTPERQPAAPPHS